MKTKIKYIAKDETEFNTESEVIEHEYLLDQIILIENTYLNGSQNQKVKDNQGYYQHSKTNLSKGWEEVIKSSRPLFKGLDNLYNTPTENIHPLGFGGRVISDCGGPLNKIWWRFSCIDDKGREWQQPYFALNPGTGTEVKIN
jgi:hypothetical protein